MTAYTQWIESFIKISLSGTVSDINVFVFHAETEAG